MQIFADRECTEYADGTKMPVYARVNVPWGLNGEWMIVKGDSGKQIDCIAPEDDEPDNPYSIILWVDFFSSEYENQFTAGQIVEINGDTANLPVNNPTVIFTKP